MKKILTLIVLLFVGWTQVKAGQVKESEARQKAEAFFHRNVGTRGGVNRLTRVYLPLMTKSAAWSVTDAPIYAYNLEGGGYVIVSGDDRTSSVLGYSEQGHLNEERLPVNMKSWLQSYVRKIERLDRVSMQQVGNRAVLNKEDIEPKLKTAWGQDYPYNLHTPELHIVWNSQERTVNAATGCVATAMAQVMNYYRYPEATEKALEAYEGSTDVPVLSENIEIPDTVKDVTWQTEDIPAGSKIDWDNIVDRYDLLNYDGTISHKYHNTEAQLEAVSRLMQYCGAAVDMNYGIESSAWDGALLSGLIEVMGYKDAYALFADEYSAQGWIEAVYQELAAAGPVQFGGNTATMGGHQFIIDGYQSKDGLDYFYANWGWDGEDDGYMLLDVLEPGWIINADGESEGFVEDQSIICGMGPNGKGITKCPFEPLYLEIFDFGTEGKTYQRPSRLRAFDITDYNIYWVNIHTPLVNAVPAIVALDEDNQLKSCTYFEEIDKGIDMAFFEYWGLSSQSVGQPFTFGRGLADGTYTIAAVIFETGTENWTLMENSESFSVKMTVTGNEATFTNSGKTTALSPLVVKPFSDDVSWYSLSGVKLNGKPTGQGIYIHNGKKVVVK